MSINIRVLIKQEFKKNKNVLCHEKTGKTLYYDILKRKRSKTNIEKKVKQNKNISKNPP